jgi:hypothetical protein
MAVAEFILCGGSSKFRYYNLLKSISSLAVTNSNHLNERRHSSSLISTAIFEGGQEEN